MGVHAFTQLVVAHVAAFFIEVCGSALLQEVLGIGAAVEAPRGLKAHQQAALGIPAPPGMGLGPASFNDNSGASILPVAGMMC
ncbi:hypothetical protein E2562_038124 [Oryza meyeriana var. granulata]|uniref:Uncharacterized protein n=1 Tax=Oryza meyeriana var. granulata TaxID=110450 RepID=A0A6G1F222_9ORYZ|nr:hypothetical protein E2562_038124 [Oryza meyeriana var. granulata]